MGEIDLRIQIARRFRLTIRLAFGSFVQKMLDLNRKRLLPRRRVEPEDISEPGEGPTENSAAAPPWWENLLFRSGSQRSRALESARALNGLGFRLQSHTSW
jgi:hypothetical protein